MKSWSCDLVQRIGRRGFCHAPPRPQRGTSPSPREVFDRATFAHSAIDHRSTIRHVVAGGEPASRLIGGHIPDRSQERAFIPMTIRETSEIPRHHRSRVTLFSYHSLRGVDRRRRSDLLAGGWSETVFALTCPAAVAWALGSDRRRRSGERPGRPARLAGIPSRPRQDPGLA